MKNAIVAALALFLIGAFALAQNTRPEEETITRAVVKLCNDWDDAYIKKDAAPLERILTADYIGIDHEGALTTKADEIRLIRSGEYVIVAVDHIEPQKVRLHGNAAIVTSVAKVKLVSKGETSTITGRATTVCVNNDGEWKIASWHASRLKQ